MEAKTFTIVVSLLIVAFIIELIRREKMTFKYSVFWLASALLMLLLAFNEPLLKGLTRFAGFELPSNFIFFLALTFFLVLCLILTVYINEQNSRSETLAQALGILEYKLDRLQHGESSAQRPEHSQD